MKRLMTEAEVIAKFGRPGAYSLVTIKLPFRMKVAWAPGETVGSIQCHKLVAVPLVAALTEVLSVYGLAEVQRLGIDKYGGCYNFRAMRGGTSYSKHSWGIAIDIDPDRNLLRETKATARFARPEYKLLLDTFEKHGFVNLGRLKNYDFMHFEYSTFNK